MLTDFSTLLILTDREHRRLASQIKRLRTHALDAEQLGELRQSWADTLAYAQLFSTHHLGELTQRAELLAEARTKQGEVHENLDSLFDSGDDDLTFDFDS